MRPDSSDHDTAAPALRALAGLLRALLALVRCAVDVARAEERSDPIVLEPRVLQPV